MSKGSVPGEKKGTYDALGAASDSGVLRDYGNPQNAPQIKDLLKEDGGDLPRHLSPYRDLLTRAVKGRLRMRVQKWRSRGKQMAWCKVEKRMKPAEGENYQDPNALCVLAANTYLLLAQIPPDDRTERDIRKARECLAALEYWRNELSPVLVAEAVLEKYDESAPLRTVE